MTKHQLSLNLICALFCMIITSCNGGVNLTIPGTQVDSSGISTNDPGATPTPSSPNDPGSNPKNRIFVSATMVRPINANSSQYFDNVCAREARRANIKGTFVALTANSESAFSEQHSVRGYIYQKFLGVESIVADSFQSLITGRNDSIYTFANQLAINTTVINNVWTGQRNFDYPADVKENCNNWSDDEGNAIVGRAGRTGSDALSIKFEECEEFAHLYCIEVE